jgi:uncharacterized membrane protein
MSKLAVILGIVVLVIAFGTAPMPLTLTLQDPTRNVTIYPNVLFAVPLILLGTLLLLYGVTVKNPQDARVT